jgi:hypothetical protein
MHCPQCGQQQASSELRFCSRCGFPLGGVMELMANGGVIPQYQAPADAAPKVSPRRKGVQQGVALVFLAAVLTPLFAVLNNYLNFPEILIALVAIIGFVGGPLRILYAAIFEEAAPQKVIYVNQPQPGIPAYTQPQPPPQRAMADVNRGRTLPPPQSIPVSNWRRPDTSELVHPPSVTENTTRLLDKRENEEPPAG